MVANLKDILIDGRYLYATIVSGTNVRLSLFLNTVLQRNIVESHLPVSYRKADLCIDV